MKSHEFARKMLGTALFLLERPEFDTGTRPMHFIDFYAKEPFVNAVKALGSGKKRFEGGDIRFHPDGVPEDVIFRVSAPRTTVCRLVRPAEYDCGSLLSPEEERVLGETAPPSDEDLPF